MKTILTTLAIALMAFVFNTNAFAGAESPTKFIQKIDELPDTEQADNERDVADSGNEGSTSAAQESDQ